MAIYGSLIQWSAACPTIDEIETMVMDCVPLKYMDNMYNLTVSHLVICMRTPEEIGKMRVHLDSLTKDIDDCIDRVKDQHTALMLINEDQYTIVARHQKELICIDVHKKAINMENALEKCNSVMAVEIEDCGTSSWNDPPSILPASDTCVWRGKERMCRYVVKVLQLKETNPYLRNMESMQQLIDCPGYGAAELMRSVPTPSNHLLFILSLV
eukprot:350239_1